MYYLLLLTFLYTSVHPSLSANMLHVSFVRKYRSQLNVAFECNIVSVVSSAQSVNNIMLFMLSSVEHIRLDNIGLTNVRAVQHV